MVFILNQILEQSWCFIIQKKIDININKYRSLAIYREWDRPPENLKKYKTCFVFGRQKDSRSTSFKILIKVRRINWNSWTQLGI